MKYLLFLFVFVLGCENKLTESPQGAQEWVLPCDRKLISANSNHNGSTSVLTRAMSEKEKEQDYLLENSYGRVVVIRECRKKRQFVDECVPQSVLEFEE